MLSWNLVVAVKVMRSGLILYLLMECSRVCKREVKDSFKFVVLSSWTVDMVIYAAGENYGE